MSTVKGLQYYAFCHAGRDYVGWFDAGGKVCAIENEGSATITIDARTMRTIDTDVVEPHVIWRRGDASSPLINRLIDRLAYAKWRAPEVDIHETYDCEKQQLEALLAAGSIATARKHSPEFHWLVDRELAQCSLQSVIGKELPWVYTITEKGRAWLDQCRLIETKLPWSPGAIN